MYQIAVYTPNHKTLKLYEKQYETIGKARGAMNLVKSNWSKKNPYAKVMIKKV